MPAADYKKKVVQEFVKLLEEYPIVGAVNMENMPTPQLQNMRAALRGKVVLKMTKRRIMKFAIEKAKEKKKGIENIEEHLGGMPALLFTKENPFTLFKTLKKSKSSAPAKAGQKAPKDIVVKAGPTPFAPGPIIGELGAVGIKSKVDAGKLVIAADAVVCKEGEVISDKLAPILLRLGIQPMEIGLDLVAVYEAGTIYTKKVLDVDEDKFIADMQTAARWALNLAVEAAYPTKESIEIMIQKAFKASKAVALEGNVMADMVVEELLGKAERQMLSLKSAANIVVEPKKKQPEPVEEKKEIPKAEEKKPEEKPKPEVKKEPEKKEEAPKEEKKVEEKIIETPKKEVTETPKIEEKKETEKPTETQKEEIKKTEEPKVEEKKEKVKPAEPEKTVEAPKEEIKEEEKKAEEKPKEVPKTEEKKEIKQEPKQPEKKPIETEEAVEKITLKKSKPTQELPTAQEIVQQTKERYDPNKEKLPTAEELLKEIQQKGTLRTKEQKEKVPTAWELMQAKKK